jgi:hypothetical protein
MAAGDAEMMQGHKPQPTGQLRRVANPWKQLEEESQP